MKADFKCLECQKISEIIYNLTEGPPSEVLCDKGHVMQRVYGKPGVIVPEWFGDDLHTSIASKMANAPSPLGKTKIHF